MEQTMTGVRRFAQWGLWFGGALVLLAAVLIGIDVLMRKFLDRSIGGADELAGYSLAIGTAWGLGAALLDRAHIRIDSLYVFFPQKIRLALDALAPCPHTAGIVKRSKRGITNSARVAYHIRNPRQKPPRLRFIGHLPSPAAEQCE